MFWIKNESKKVLQFLFQGLKTIPLTMYSYPDQIVVQRLTVAF